MNLLSKELSLKQEWIAKAKLIRCPTPLPETTPDFVLTRMLEVAPLEEGEEGNKEATASAKEAARKGGIENPSIQGKKRTASKDLETMVSKRGRNLRQRVLCREMPRPHCAPKGISPPPSCM